MLMLRSLTVVAALASPLYADTLKIATLAPEGTSWMRLFHAWQEKVAERTEGRVKIKIYTGGTMGDEHDMLRKLKLGQLAGAAITGIGISSISPEVRTLEIARSYEELDLLRAALEPDIEKVLAEKGYVVGSWVDVGPVHLFSQKPLASLDDLRGVRLWMWSDDPVQKQLLGKLGINGVPLGVPEVLPGLSTGQIDTFFGSPLAVMALQWGTHAKYMASNILAEATGATLFSKKAWDAIAPADQKILRDEAAAMQAAVKKQVRDDNDKAFEAMKRQGLKVYAFPPALMKTLDAAAEEIARASSNKVSKEFSDKAWKQFELIKKKRGG